MGKFRQSKNDPLSFPGLATVIRMLPYITAHASHGLELAPS